ncbi:uncharacterized protein E0L32_011770 [Thyridium curvatum]|uniref:cellulase n=1 Tax=Thyridium curvatum TaxID=1093900 RepID=A0A507BMA1_9PEZI|nr:uncharacterized protein E0L32_011770 [Thyridium curvatum]TPX18321.1 hypothetical protein E0L32_011770 [Thyridium curvatum]
MYSQAWVPIAIAALPLGALAASGKAVTTRFWDCCKPSCAWSGKAAVSHPVLTCEKGDNKLFDAQLASGCAGGPAFMCSGAKPWAINGVVSYGFAGTAITGGSEASCLTFTSGKVKGKKMVVQSLNTGTDLTSNHFDLQIPGGGQGIFSGCVAQYGSSPGAQYGGISDRDHCSQLPAALRAGCEWRFDWFLDADNPDVEFEQVQCPKELTAVSGCKREDDGKFPVFQMPTETAIAAPTPSETAALYKQCDGHGWDVAKLCLSTTASSSKVSSSTSSAAVQAAVTSQPASNGSSKSNFKQTFPFMLPLLASVVGALLLIN